MRQVQKISSKIGESFSKRNNMVDRVGKILQHIIQSVPAEFAVRRVARTIDEVGDKVRQLPVRQPLLKLLSAALAILVLSACVSSEYMGISLRPGAASIELQKLARRARTGDKQAQLELGIRFEEGNGLPRDERRALKLYQQAAMEGGGMQTMYIPSSNGVRAQPMSAGAARSASREAVQRIRSIQPSPRVFSNERQKSSVQLEWYVFSSGQKGMDFCPIKFRESFVSCTKINMPEKTFGYNIGKVVQMNDAIVSIDGVTICGIGLCQQNETIFIGQFYEQRDSIMAYVYKDNIIFGYLVDRENSGFEPKVHGIYDLFYLRNYNHWDDSQFDSIVYDVSNILNRRVN